MNELRHMGLGLAILLSGCGAQPLGMPGEEGDDIDVSTEELATGVADWAQSGRTPRRTSYNPLESTINGDNATDLIVSWTCCEQSGPFGLALWRDRLFVTNTDPGVEEFEPNFGLAALDPDTGTRLWTTTMSELGAPPFALGLAIGYGRIHAQTEYFSADFSTKTGQHLGRGGLGNGTDNWIAPPLVKERRVVVETADSYFADVGETVPGIWCVDADTGVRVWSKSLSPVPNQELQGPRTPALANGHIFSVNGNSPFTSGDNSLVSLSVDSGNVRWTAAPASGILGSPSILHGRIFVMARPSTLLAFDERTGNALWQAAHSGDFAGRFPLPAPAIDESSVYVALNAAGGGVVLGAFEAETGEARWSTILGTSARGRRSSMAVAGGLVYVGTEAGSLHVVSVENGIERATHQLGASIGDIIVANGRVHVATGGAGVQTLELPAE